jgi:serine/threonine-protein kinase
LVASAGQGNTSDVFFVRPTHSGEDDPADYALKRLRTDHASDRLALQMFRREAQCGHQASHANLLPTLISDFSASTPFLVMPRLQGATIGEVLETVDRITIPRALWIARQVAEACQALHESGWLHGDIKPSNVYADSTGHVTLFDFGFSRPIGESALSHERMLMATLCYAAPELFTSSRVSGAASDVYSIGVMLYEMLCGQKPFDESSPERLCEAHLTSPPPSPRTHHPGIPTDVSQCVTRILSKEPDRRPSSSELVEQLVRLEVSTFSLR